MLQIGEPHKFGRRIFAGGCKARTWAMPRCPRRLIRSRTGGKWFEALGSNKTLHTGTNLVAQAKRRGRRRPRRVRWSCGAPHQCVAAIGETERGRAIIFVTNAIVQNYVVPAPVPGVVPERTGDGKKLFSMRTAGFFATLAASALITPGSTLEKTRTDSVAKTIRDRYNRACPGRFTTGGR